MVYGILNKEEDGTLLHSSLLLLF